MLTLPSLCLISSKQTVSSISQSLSCFTGLKVIVAQDKTPKRGCRLLRLPVVDNHHGSRLTCCPPHDWSSTARVAHQRGRSWGGEVLTPWKYVGKSDYILSPLKMLYSFIQNCWNCAFFTASRMNSWILSLHWSCLWWRCYHPSLISSKQTVSLQRRHSLWRSGSRPGRDGPDFRLLCLCC